MSFETIHTFDLCGLPFQVLWKSGGCLLRMTESPQGPDRRNYTVSDLYVALFDGSPDFELSAEEAIEQAPLHAELILVDARSKEVQHMARIYGFKAVPAEFPVYQIRDLEVGAARHPMIWASHLGNIYVRHGGEWHYADWGWSLAEAETKARTFLGGLPPEPVPTDLWARMRGWFGG